MKVATTHYFKLTKLDIESIYSVQLNREYNGLSKNFQGELNCWLRDGRTIEYAINGDFYNYGTSSTTVSGGVGVNAGVDKKVTVTFTYAYTSNHYKYFYEHITKRFGT